jgi:hypothetical protein
MTSRGSHDRPGRTTAATGSPGRPETPELAKVRAIAPEILLTARTQRWKPEELLRVLIDAEINACGSATSPPPT